MDVNQVRFGNYSIGNPKGGSPRKSEENTNETQAQTQAQLTSSANPKDVMDALGLAGMQNLAFVSKAEAKEINPSDYLSEERISDIEAMMAEFEAGVETAANTIEAEFPGMFSAEQKNTLGAQIFSSLG